MFANLSFIVRDTAGSVSRQEHPCGGAHVYCPEGSLEPTPVAEGYYSVNDRTPGDDSASLAGVVVRKHCQMFSSVSRFIRCFCIGRSSNSVFTFVFWDVLGQVQGRLLVHYAHHRRNARQGTTVLVV